LAGYTAKNTRKIMPKKATLPLFSDTPRDEAAPGLPEVQYDIPPREKFCGLMLVGEAPGAEEAKMGRPFVGRSGQLLNEVLKEAGIERERCIVANVFRFRPPDNKVDHFFASRRAAAQNNFGILEELGKFGNAYCRAAYADEIAHLTKVMKEWKPKAVVVLGRTPLWALTGMNRILAERGKVLECRLLQGTKVVATYHPSFIVRGNWGLKPQWIGDLQKAKSFIEN
jgi:DNA polymerase